jgi:hypothetical protein
MKTRLRTVKANDITYDALLFVCPGCVAGGPEGYDGLHMLPVNNEHDIGKPNWTWNGDLQKPTLSPSILSKGYNVCHSFLEDGVFRFLTDSDHPLSGQSVPIPDLPDWAVEFSDEEEEPDSDG